MPDLPRIQDTVISWNSGRLVVAGVPMNGIGSLDTEHTRERKLVRGQTRDGVALGFTSGKYEAKPLTITFLLDQYTKLLRPVLTALGVGSPGDSSFIATYTYEEPFNPQLTTNFGWKGCKLVGEKHSATEGVDEATMDVTIMPLVMLVDTFSLASLIRSLSQ